MYREIFGRVIFPMADRITGTHISPLLKSLEKSQWLPEREMREIQEKRLRALVSFSYREVPYYRRAMKERGLLPEDIRTLSDLGRLPVLRKSDVQLSSDELRPVNYDGRVLNGRAGDRTGRRSSSFGAWMTTARPGLLPFGAGGGRVTGPGTASSTSGEVPSPSWPAET